MYNTSMNNWLKLTNMLSLRRTRGGSGRRRRNTKTLQGVALQSLAALRLGEYIHARCVRGPDGRLGRLQGQRHRKRRWRLWLLLARVASAAGEYRPWGRQHTVVRTLHRVGVLAGQGHGCYATGWRVGGQSVLV